MEAKWYYSEDGKALGPMSADEIADRISGAENEPHFVWIEGMSDWTDVSVVPEFSTALPRTETALASAGAGTKAASAKKASLAQRARHELYEFLVVSAYLYVCFGALIFYKSSILHSEGIAFAAYGVAIAKALILGKFLLTLEAFKIGEDKKHARTALSSILKKSLLFTLLLLVLTVVEELIVGHFHGRAGREVLSELAGGTWQQAVAVAILLFLILVPYFGVQEIKKRLGEGNLMKLLTERPPPEVET
jgi:hypothetical protein